jgi:3-oxoacyl-[acyl-carrier protein] reductase
MDFNLRNKKAVVTAATSGLGYATARALAQEGASVAICGRDLNRAEAAAARLRSETDSLIVPFEADVARENDLARFFEQASEALGGVGILVCNAGGPPAGDFKNLAEEQWEVAYQLTLLSVVRSVRFALPHMQKQGGGRVLAIVSSSVKRSLPNLTLSNIFRPAVQGLCKSLSIELAGDNIQVNCLAPGRIATERTDSLDRQRAKNQSVSFEEVRAASVAQIPQGRFGTPSEFGQVAAFLCSDAALYINGSTMLVDGGGVNCL